MSKHDFATAYAVQRRNQGEPIVALQNPQKFAQGGEVAEERSLKENYCAHCGQAYAHGGEVAAQVGPQEDEPMDFLEPGADTVPDGSQLDDLDNETDPASEDEDDEQQKGKIDLRHIMAAVRRRHRG